MATKLFNLRLDSDFLGELKVFAKAHYMTTATLIRLALQEYLKNHASD